jgi:hypothetical protein
MGDDYTVNTENLRLVKIEAVYTSYAIAHQNDVLEDVIPDESFSEPSFRYEEVNAMELPISADQVVYSDSVRSDLKYISERAATQGVPEFCDDVKEDIVSALRLEAFYMHSKRFNQELLLEQGGTVNTRPTLKRGDAGTAVQDLQTYLNQIAQHTGARVDGAPLRKDGSFGPATEKAVLSFQTGQDLYADGVVGPVTWGKMDEVWSRHINPVAQPAKDKPEPTQTVVQWQTTYKEGYNRFTLRTDVARIFQDKILDPMKSVGALMTSSGSKRALTAKVGSNRSATSFHYLLTAFDLYVYSAMVDPHTDPFVVTVDPNNPRYWVVWARVGATGSGRHRTLDAVTYEKSGDADYPQKIVKTAGYFLNFTELCAEAGFKPIPWRPAFMDPKTKSNGAAEWWHFQYEADLVRGVTTYGSQLLRVYTQKQLKDTPPWKYRDLKFGTQWR